MLRKNTERGLRNLETADVIALGMLPIQWSPQPRIGIRDGLGPVTPAESFMKDPAAPTIGPSIRGTTLANGIPVAFSTLHDCGLVCIDIWVDAGSRCESDAELGLAHFLEHMLFKGSEGLAEGEFDLRIEALGGISNAATGFDDVHYKVLCPAVAASEAMELLANLVLHPALADQSFRMEQLVVREELRQSLDQPDEVACSTLLQRACGTHRYGQPILGSEDSLTGLTVATMQAFHHHWYTADRLAIVVTGAVDPERCLGDLERSSLGRLAAASTDIPCHGRQPLAPEQLGAVVAGETMLRLKRLGCARLMACWVMPPAVARSQISGLELVAALLSGGRRSWLVGRLREELGVVDDVDIDVIPLEGGSLVLLETSCQPSQLGHVENLLRQALADWLQQPPRQDDLHRACRQIVNGLCFGLEHVAGMATYMGPALLRRRLEPVEQELDRFRGWQAAGLHEQVMPLFAPDRAHWLSVLPEDDG